MTQLLSGPLPTGRDDDPAGSFDLAFVGAGASTSYVLLGLLGNLAERPPAAAVRIAVVEPADDPFTGVAYGSRAARTSLLITTLHDFLPDAERRLFAEWLSANKHWVFDEFREARGPFSRRWWERHEEAIARDEFDHMFLPRYVFGTYLVERLQRAIDQASTAGRATVRVVRDEATAVEQAPHGYTVRMRSGDLPTRRVVLAAGSPPVLPRLGGLRAPDATALVDAPFEGMSDALHRIEAAIRQSDPSRPPHVVFLGANAGTMDMLYQVNNLDLPEMRTTVFTVLTPSGLLPESLGRGEGGRAYRPPRLAALRDSTGPLTAVCLFESAVADLEEARAAGLTVADTLHPVSGAVGDLLSRLSSEETLEFAARWGVELGRHQRRAGWEYSEVAETLQAQGRLRSVAGSFVEAVVAPGGGVSVRYTRDGEQRLLDGPADAVVNCAGPARHLRNAPSTLLGQLLDAGLCTTSRYGAGIAVDPMLMAAPGLYVMGPLLAGNMVKGAPVWHMEHCGRISAFGTALGHDLARDVAAVTG